MKQNPQSIGARDANASLPIHYTCRNKQMPLDTIKFLLFHQPNLAHKVDMEGRLQLQLCVSKYQSETHRATDKTTCSES